MIGWILKSVIEKRLWSRCWPRLEKLVKTLDGVTKLEVIL
jgi:hypothetical protein